MRTPEKTRERFNFKHSTAATGKQVTVPGVPVLEWVNTSTLSELFSAVNKLNGLFDITCNSFIVSDNNIDYMTSGAPRTKHYQLASNKLGLCLGWKGGRGRREGKEGGEGGRGGREGGREGVWEGVWECGRQAGM